MKTPRPFDLKFIENFVYDETSVSGLSLAKTVNILVTQTKTKMEDLYLFLSISPVSRKQQTELFGRFLTEPSLKDML